MPHKPALDGEDGFCNDEGVGIGGGPLVSDLSKLADLVELDTLPPWIREQIEANKQGILQKLLAEGSFVFRGPHGEEATIRRKMRAAAA